MTHSAPVRSLLNQNRVPANRFTGCAGKGAAALAIALLPVLFGCDSSRVIQSATGTTPGVITLQGKVKGGQQPIIGSTVQLYAVGTTADQSAATPLIASSVITGVAGDFNITGLYTCPNITSEVYLISKGGNPGLAAGTNNQASVLMTALGPCGNLSSSTHIIINEVTTIGSIYPITQFVGSYLNVGSSPANANTLANDFMQINQFINTDGGASPGPALPGGFSAPVANLNTLANSMSACVNTTGGVAGDGTNCGNFLLYAKPSGGTAPTNTADAILDIANNPTNNVANIFSLSSAVPAFQPSLGSAPADWTLKILPNITLATPSNLVGVGSTNTGTITLGQAAPAGGLSITLVSDNTSAVTVVSPVNIAAGAASGTFSYTGIAAGTANITANATGYVSSSVTLSATASLISLGAVPTVAPGQSVDLPLSLGTPAPAGGVTINFTSSNTSVATITPASVFIAGGLKVPVANPKVNGLTVGTTTINATATGYAPGAQSANVSVSASFPPTFTVPVGTPTNITLTISAPAPSGGITFTLSSDLTSIFTVPANVTVLQGATTANVAITGVAPGTTTLRADSPNIVEASSSVSVNSTITLQTPAITTGKQLEVGSYFALNATPPSPVTATLTSSTPSVAVVSSSATILGGATATITNIVNTSANTYYIQGVNVGSATITVAVAGYTNATVSVTVDPSGFVIFSPGSIATTTLSADSTFNIDPAILNPADNSVIGYGNLNPGSNVNLAVTSGTTATGTIVTSPITFVANDSGEAATFHPVAAGTSTLSIATPAGFTTPAPSSTQQITATVTAPPILTQSSSTTSGVGLEVANYAALSQTPKVPTAITVTSNNPGVAVVSSNLTTVGGATVTFTNITNTSANTFYIQGVALGTTTLTIAAPSYATATVNITVDPGGFVIFGPSSISTTTFSASSSLQINPAILNPVDSSVIAFAAASPAVSPVNVVVTSSQTSVGTITNSPVAFQGGDTSKNAIFQPVGAGTSNLSLGTPAGFSTPTPSNTQQITATVTAPPITVQNPSLQTGVNMEMSSYVALSQTPPTPTLVTLTVDKPAVVTVSNSATIVGAASTTFPNTVNTSALSFYIQGQSLGTATITVSAPGYQSNTISVIVQPSGFVIYQPSVINTTTFSAATSIQINPVFLAPANLSVLGYPSLNPGIGTVPLTFTSSATQVGTITSPITFTGGSSSQPATFQPIAAGSTTLSLATPAGYSTPTPASTQAITANVSAPAITVQTSNLTTGSELEVSTYGALSQTPPSPVTLTIVSNNASIATISTSAAVLGGNTLTYPNTNNTSALSFYVQGHSVGTTTLTFSAPGYSNATMNITVGPAGFVIYQPGNFSTTTFSSTTGIQIQPAYLSPGTLNVLGYAAVNPGIASPQVVVTSGTPSVGTVTSPVTFAAGASFVNSTFQPSTAGSTTISINTPAGFSTPSSAASQQITATVSAPSITVQSSSLTTGASLQISTYAALSQTPPVPTTVTITSSNPASLLLSKALLTSGTSSLTFTNVADNGALGYYVQGQATGSSTLTITAAGYATATVNVIVNPSGFVIYQPTIINTTTFSNFTNIQIAPVILNSGVLTVQGIASLNPGVSASVPITSSVPGVGTVTNPVNFNPGDNVSNSHFQPIAAGSTTISISTPAGFTTPSLSSTQQITANVTAPPVGAQTANLTTGAKLQVQSYTYLTQTPPAPVSVTVTSNNTAIVTVAPNATTVGTASVVFSGVANTSALSFSLQGQSPGTTTLTLSAPGYASATMNITIGPSGFVIFSPANFNTTVGAANTTVTIEPAVLNAGVLTVYNYAALNPGLGTVNVPIGSTSPQIGTITPTTLAFNATDTSQTASFHPVAVGTTDVVIVSQPPGFTTPSQTATQQIIINVQ